MKKHASKNLEDIKSSFKVQKDFCPQKYQNVPGTLFHVFFSVDYN